MIDVLRRLRAGTWNAQIERVEYIWQRRVAMGHDDLDSLRIALQEFAAARDWDKFHSPKNLCCALSVEVGELLEHFQWEQDTAPVSDEKRERIADEIGDVLIYLVRLSDKLGIDPLVAAEDKLKKNAAKYPVHLARGSSKKYTEF